MSTTWLLARGAGLTALVLLTATTTLGALGSGRRRSAGRRYVLQYVHRTTAGLGLVALAVHLTAVLADAYAGVGWVGALVPFTSGYRPGWVALGTLAAWLSLGVGVLGLARGRLAVTAAGARTWRALHLLGYAAWAAAIAHGFGSGTDSTVGWVRLLYLLCLAAVAGAVGVRLARPDPRTDDGRLTAPTATAAPRVLEGATR